MTQLFALHSSYGLATAVAALDEGLLGDDERVLVPFHSARVPETSEGIAHTRALAGLRGRFDRVEDLGELLGARHPSSWSPEDDDLPMLSRLLCRAWQVDPRQLELFVQSPQVAPARTLMELFPGAPVTVVGDGLMTYSPMRVRMSHAVAARIGRVVYADVVPGVRPLVGSPAATPVPVRADAFRATLEQTGAGDALDVAADGTPTVLVLGQYLSALGLMSAHDEVALQSRLIDRAMRWQPGRVVFAPHPLAPPLLSDALRDRARAHGVPFAQHRGAVPAELLASRLGARAVVACFSTALPTVRSLYGIPIGSAGVDTVLAGLVPYENSNRIPATIVDALTRPDSPYAEPDSLQALVDAVGYAMQPVVAAHLRERAEEVLSALDADERDRYFSPERLASLRLPGAPAAGRVRRMLSGEGVGGVGRLEEARLTVRGARSRVRRAWKAIRGR